MGNLFVALSRAELYLFLLLVLCSLKPPTHYMHFPVDYPLSNTLGIP